MGYKVLFITNWYPTPKNQVNGIFIKEHAKALMNEGHNLVILHFDISYNKSFLRFKRHFLDEDGSAPIYRIEIQSRFWKWFYHCIPLLNILALDECRKMAKNNFHPQIIHANVIFPSGLVGYFLSKRLKIPAVLSEHWSGFESFCRHPLFGRITRKAVSHYECIMPVSKYLGGVIRQYTDENKHISIVPNVIDSAIFNVKSSIHDSSQISFLMTANWQSRKKITKRPDLIIDALKLFASRTIKKVKLSIIGEGDVLNKIKHESHAYNFDCEFLGYRNKMEINEILQGTDFFLHASNFETFSIVTVEALLTGTPVIVSDLPALRELVNSDNGILVKNDATEWAEAISLADKRNWDHEKIAAAVLKKYSYEAIGQKITAVYDQVVINYKSLNLLK